MSKSRTKVYVAGMPAPAWHACSDLTSRGYRTQLDSGKFRECDVVYRADDTDFADRECDLARALGIPVVTSIDELPPAEGVDPDEVVETVDQAIKQQVGGSHYVDMPIQPVEYIVANGLGYCEGAVVKYVSRWQKKSGIEDLRKARHFIDLLIEMQHGKAA